MKNILNNKKYLIIALFVIAMLFLIPNLSNAAVEVTKSIYANDGSMRFSFTGLDLDTTHEYNYAFTSSDTTQISRWNVLSNFTATTATVNISGSNSDDVNVILANDRGYITIKDNTDDIIVLEPYAVDLSIPYFKLTNYRVIDNGKMLYNGDSYITMNLWHNSNSTAYYQFEKITDTDVISQYRTIKASNGDFNQLQSALKTEVPDNDNWTSWDHWYIDLSHYPYGAKGYTQSEVSGPGEGLYYMWIWINGNNVKDAYGYILVDNLDDEIALDSISLPQTKEVKLGETLTLTPTFNPVNTTNKSVTWKSSDETVATVDANGKITPVKLGSTIITVTSEDESKNATCTVTVVAATSNDDSNNNNGNTDTNNGSSAGTKTTDGTTAKGAIPQTGEGITIIFTIAILLIAGTFAYFRFFKYKDIK